MGFVAVEPGLLLGSGHPDPAEQPPLHPSNLGLISSVDGAETWESISLSGETDFHDLDTSTLPSGELRIYGYDATAGTIKVSSDSGATWEDGASLQMRDLAADPVMPDRVYATTADGLLVSDDSGKTFQPLPGAPALYLVAAAPDSGQLLGIDTEGTIWTSDGTSWTENGSVSGTPEALAFIGGDAPWILIADERGIIASDDYGETSTVLVAGKE